MSDISHSRTARFHIGPELRARHEQSGLVHRLTPEFEKWKDEMDPGEMWSLFGEKWLIRQEAT